MKQEFNELGIILGYIITYMNTDMETGNLIHLGAELVVQMLMLYSTSPHARRLTSQMLTDDPFTIDVKLDMNSTNRNAEILNVYLKTMGLKLSFRKIPKKFIHPIAIDPLAYYMPPNELIQPLAPIHENEKFDIEADCERLVKSKNTIRPMVIYPMEYYTPIEETTSEE